MVSLALCTPIPGIVGGGAVFGGKAPRRSRNGRRYWMVALALCKPKQGVVGRGEFVGRTEPRRSSKGGRFPFDIACSDYTSSELLRVLVERAPATVKMTEDGEKLPLPLHFACNRQASVAVVKFLVGIDPDAVKTANSDGNLPLHLACCNHAKFDVVQVLAKENPAAVEKGNNDGTLPFHLACTAQAPLQVVQF
jgi:hypothetical protein